MARSHRPGVAANGRRRSARGLTVPAAAPVPPSYRSPRRLPSLKTALFGGVVLSLVALFGLALARELRPVPSTAVGPALLPTPRPALTAAEEGYAQALWPLHNEVKAAAIRMNLGGLSYKTQGLDRAGLKARLDANLLVYRRAETQIRALTPPPSFQRYHDDYLRAVQLFAASATEMLKTVDDGDDDHLVTAFPLSQEAGLILREVGSTLWPGEYVPN